MTAENVYIIDDEPSICEACVTVLEENGFRAEYSLTGGQGLDEVLSGRWGVVLLDMKLPDMDGMDILDRLRDQAPDVQVIVMTGYSTVDNAVAAMKAGAFDYLKKPFTEDILLVSVNKTAEKIRLVGENRTLRRELLGRYDFTNIVGEGPAMQKVFDQVKRAAPTDATVLIQGESGTGKELIARAIHANSLLAGGVFIPVDCSALANGLLESELFGHKKGAYTGAVENHAGIFETAGQGTLFLDEVSNLSPEIQAKLLRVLETREFKPVGDSRMKTTDARIVAASNRDLAPMVEKELFREDLYYRLNVFPLQLPALRERKEDIPRLAYHFLRRFSRKTGRKIRGFTDGALEMLVQYDWPGNVRQLKNTVERLVIMSDEETMTPAHLSAHLEVCGGRLEPKIPETAAQLAQAKKRILEETFGKVQKAFLHKALLNSGGNLTRAAETVGMQRSNFSALVKKHGLRLDDFKTPAA